MQLPPSTPKLGWIRVFGRLRRTRSKMDFVEPRTLPPRRDVCGSRIDQEEVGPTDLQVYNRRPPTPSDYSHNAPQRPRVLDTPITAAFNQILGDLENELPELVDNLNLAGPSSSKPLQQQQQEMPKIAMLET